jgi:penicillin amidase
MTPFETRLRYLLSTLSVLLLLALVVAVWGWWRIRRSLPQIDGGRNVAGLAAPVIIERDALGVPTIGGTTRLDVARATGFVHAQDRFFQMDLLRRTGAGELSELFGERTLEIDRKHRLHGFRRLAEKILAALPAEQRTILDAYAAGVNAGLAASSAKPWEYVVLRTDPQSWRTEDSLLVAYAMWFDLQDASARYEQSIRALRIGLGQTGLDFFAPLGDSWDAALDGSTYQPAPLPPLRLKPADPATTASVSQPVEPRSLPGSNAFGISGAHTVTSSAMLANDMHLSLNVPHIWYRAVLKWTDATGTAHHVAGVTLPGMPAVVAGSNGHIAWGETNSYVDTSDVVLVETEVTAHALYRTPHGWIEIQERSDPIKVKGKDAVPFIARWTEWGPLIGELQDNRYPALRWNAHDIESTNLNFMELETARTVDEAVAIGHRAGMPNQNLVVADMAGSIAWTVTGTLPRRVGFDGRQPLSWAFGDRKWDGWLKADEIPVIKIPGTSAPSDPPAAPNAAMDKLAKEGILWTANQRLVGGAALANLGDNGYEGGARATQIRDGLRQLVSSGKKAAPADLLAIQLDDRALYLERWQKVLLAVLSDEAVAENRLRAEIRDAVRLWNGHASTDSAAYRLVRSFHQKLAERAFQPFFDKARETYPDFSYNQFHFDDALWRLVQEKPARLLNPANKSWEDLMLAAADDVVAEVDKAGLPVARFTWGAHNTLRMQHPFSHILPGLTGRFLDMPAESLPGDNDMPRVQAPAFGASERMVVSPGHENEGILHMPGGQSGNPLSPYYRAGHEAWVKGEPTPFLPGPTQHTLTLKP